MLKETDIQEEFSNFLIESQKQVDNCNKIKLEYLNSNRNPKIKEAVKKLLIFEKPT